MLCYALRCNKNMKSYAAVTVESWCFCGEKAMALHRKGNGFALGSMLLYAEIVMPLR